MSNYAKTQPLLVSKQKDIVIERKFDLPATAVWKAWTDPGSLKKWWGPKDFTCSYSSIDLRAGGTYLNCMLSPTGEEFWSTGVYIEVSPYSRLVLTESFTDEEGKNIPASALNMPGEWPMLLLITLDFEEDGDQTIMNFKQKGVPTEAYDECLRGWNQSLDKLAAMD